MKKKSIFIEIFHNKRQCMSHTSIEAFNQQYQFEHFIYIFDVLLYMCVYCNSLSVWTCVCGTIHIRETNWVLFLFVRLMRTNESYCKAKPAQKTKAIICVFSFWKKKKKYTEIEIRPKDIVIEWNVVEKNGVC